MLVGSCTADDGMAVQKALQAVAEGTGWTYSVLWKLCPHQGWVRAQPAAMRGARSR